MLIKKVKISPAEAFNQECPRNRAENSFSSFDLVAQLLII